MDLATKILGSIVVLCLFSGAMIVSWPAIKEQYAMLRNGVCTMVSDVRNWWAS